MGDVGIEKLIPKYEKSLLTPADVAFWEVTYQDGTALREYDGAKYDQIDRARLASFKIVYGGETLMEAFPPPGKSGLNLVYRRRTSLGQSGAGRRVLFVFGWAPGGPVFALDIAGSRYRALPDGFDPQDPELYPPVPVPGEPDNLLV